MIRVTRLTLFFQTALISIKGKNQVCTSDHLAITLELGPAKHKTFPKHKIYNFKKANWTDLINELKNVNWKAALQYCDADTAWATSKLSFLPFVIST